MMIFAYETCDYRPMYRCASCGRLGEGPRADLNPEFRRPITGRGGSWNTPDGFYYGSVMDSRLPPHDHRTCKQTPKDVPFTSGGSQCGGTCPDDGGDE